MNQLSLWSQAFATLQEVEARVRAPQAQEVPQEISGAVHEAAKHFMGFCATAPTWPDFAMQVIAKERLYSQLPDRDYQLFQALCGLMWNHRKEIARLAAEGGLPVISQGFGEYRLSDELEQCVRRYLVRVAVELPDINAASWDVISRN